GTGHGVGTRRPDRGRGRPADGRDDPLVSRTVRRPRDVAEAGRAAARGGTAVAGDYAYRRCRPGGPRAARGARAAGGGGGTRRVEYGHTRGVWWHCGVTCLSRHGDPRSAPQLNATP